MKAKLCAALFLASGVVSCSGAPSGEDSRQSSQNSGSAAKRSEAAGALEFTTLDNILDAARAARRAAGGAADTALDAGRVAGKGDTPNLPKGAGAASGANSGLPSSPGSPNVGNSGGVSGSGFDPSIQFGEITPLGPPPVPQKPRTTGQLDEAIGQVALLGPDAPFDETYEAMRRAGEALKEIYNQNPGKTHLDHITDDGSFAKYNDAKKLYQDIYNSLIPEVPNPPRIPDRGSQSIPTAVMRAWDDYYRQAAEAGRRLRALERLPNLHSIKPPAGWASDLCKDVVESCFGVTRDQLKNLADEFAQRQARYYDYLQQELQNLRRKADRDTDLERKIQDRLAPILNNPVPSMSTPEKMLDGIIGRTQESPPNPYQ